MLSNYLNELDLISELLNSRNRHDFIQALVSNLAQKTDARRCLIYTQDQAGDSLAEWTSDALVDDSLLIKIASYLSRLSTAAQSSLAINEKTSSSKKFINTLQELNCNSAFVGNLPELDNVTVTVVLIGNNSELLITESDLDYFDHILLACSKLYMKFNTTNIELPWANFDNLGRLTSANDSYLKILGVDLTQVHRMHFSDLQQRFVVDEDREHVSNYYWRVFESRRTQVEGKKYRIKNSQGVEKALIDTFISNQSGEGFRSVFVPLLAEDVRQSNRVQVKDSERYKRLVENSDAIIFHVDASHQISFISQRALDFFGVAAENFLSGQRVEWFDLIHIEDRERVRSEAFLAAKKASSFDEELRVVNHLTGRLRWLLVRLVPVQEYSGAIKGWDAFGVDITVRKEALRELDTQRNAYKQQARKLSALYRLSHDLSGFLSVDEIFQRAFEVIRDELGFKRLWVGLLDETGTKIVGQAAYGPGWKRHLVQLNLEVTGSNHPIARVVLSRSPLVIGSTSDLLGDENVQRFFSKFEIKSVGIVPLISGGQVLGVLAFQPDSEQIEIDQEVLTLISSLAAEIASALLAKRLEERAGDSEKMRAAGLLAAGVAHNFNNLLQAILGQSSLLEMQDQNNKKVHNAAAVINDAANKGAILVRQLMSFANLEEPSSEVCDVNAFLERAQVSLKRNLKPNQQLFIHFADDLPRAFVDSRQLMRILNALLLNAREAMELEGRVEISIDSFSIAEDTPHYEVPLGDYVRIAVKDNGIGMDGETKRRCFEPFFTTKDIDPSSGIGLSGSGLGLAAAYALARKNGGLLVVDSAKGQGSLFTVYLPVATEALIKKKNQSEAKSVANFAD